MPASQVLQQLYSLKPSSPNFLRVLYALIQSDDDEQYSSGLKGEELTRLVDFLDDALCFIPTSDDVFQRCLRKLRGICGCHRTLPSSCIISGNLSRTNESPAARGRFADVWEGDQDGTRVCIKVPRIRQEDTIDGPKKSFYEEAVVWKRLRHPNIVPFLGATTEPLQFVSEWIPNGVLTDYVTKNPEANRIALLLDVAEGLNYLHASHTIHGDLKGSNILVKSDGHACLADFGLASIIYENDPIAAGARVHTVRWTAPEILEGAGKVTREADVFSFGMVVMEAFTGRRPLSELSAPSVMRKTMAGERPVYPRGAEGLGFVAPIWNMTVDCWGHEPARRPTMAVVVVFLRECYTLHNADPSLSALSPWNPAVIAGDPSTYETISPASPDDHIGLTRLMEASQGFGKLPFQTQEHSVTQSPMFDIFSPGVANSSHSSLDNSFYDESCAHSNPSNSSRDHSMEIIYPFLPASAPSHAFPTSYPPPSRPSSVIPPVKVRQEPSTPPRSPSTSSHDLDSLCLRFTKSLVIDESPVQSSQPKVSVSSLNLTTALKDRPSGTSDHREPTPSPTSGGPTLLVQHTMHQGSLFRPNYPLIEDESISGVHYLYSSPSPQDNPYPTSTPYFDEFEQINEKNFARTVTEGQVYVVTPEDVSEDVFTSEVEITDPVGVLELDLYSSAQATGYQDGDLRGCLRGTRGTILEKIESWISGPARPSIFWLNGVAGIGKSAIARTVVERCDARGRLVSSFFCSRDVDYKNPRPLFPSLAIQLARQHPKIRSPLASLLRANPDVVYESPSEQVEKLIVKPLKSVDDLVVIIVDALDEWGDDLSQFGILSALEDWIKEMPKVKFLVTSRPNPLISASLNLSILSGVAGIYTLHAIEPHVADKDIRNFLEYELSLLATQEGLADWPTAAQLDLLCARATGLFVYAVATVKFLGNKNISPSEQYAIVERSPDETVHEGVVEGVHKGLSLDCLCTTAFQASFRYNDAEDDDAVRSVLAGVVLVTHPVPPSAIANLTSLETDEVMTILESIQPLLRLQGPDQPVRPFHKLLSDLLTSPNRCADERFYIAPGKFHTLIALGCLNLMNKTLEGALSPLHHTTDTEVKHSHETVALKYACISWHIHLAKSRELATSLVPPLHRFLKENFTSWLSVPDAMGVATDPLTALNTTISWLGEMIEDTELLNATEQCLLRVRSST